MKAHELDLESEVFNSLRFMMSHFIIDTVKRMQEKDLSEGSVTAKIKIGIMRHVDDNGEVHSTVIFEPKVTGKVGRTTEDKLNPVGGRITIGQDGTLLIGNEQVSMDELMDEQKGA